MKIKIKSNAKVDRVTYASLAALVRESTGRKRLTPDEVAEVRAAVQRHHDRQTAPPHPREREGRFLQMYRERIQNRVKQLFYRHYRTPSGRWVGGETDVRVEFVARASDVNITADTFTVWHRRHKWQGRNLDVTIRVPYDWRHSVEGAGLADAGGMLTLAAEPVAPNVWQATWARQGRGFDVVVEHGYIARRGDGSHYHSKGLQRALREAGARCAPKARVADAYERVKQMSPAEIAAQYGHLTITVADSIRGGNCRAGTMQWIERHANRQKQGTIAELLAIAKKPGPYVLNAIAAAVARHEGEAAVLQ